MLTSLFLAVSNSVSSSSNSIDNLYIILGIIVSAGTILFGVSRIMKNFKSDIAKDITLTVIEQTKVQVSTSVKLAVSTEVTSAVQLAVSKEVKDAIGELNYKITQNGKNTNNLGDVAARTEENVQAVKDTIDKLIPLVQSNNNVLMTHIGAHLGHGDQWIK